jgi:hypothetical protein
MCDLFETMLMLKLNLLFNFIYLLFIGQYSWLIYVPLSSARQNKESEKGLFNKNKYKDICKSERWYANKNKELSNY